MKVLHFFNVIFKTTLRKVQFTDKCYNYREFYLNFQKSLVFSETNILNKNNFVARLNTEI